uniref:Isopenicillin N synthase-like Fe(2+) 2OG dioxygenase domain-containing protein n=1 Tax=Oryza punctata TaxID=4537 RepID=A0A0E0L7Z8_ORYPU
MANLLSLDKDYFTNQLGENATTHVGFNYYQSAPILGLLMASSLTLMKPFFPFSWLTTMSMAFRVVITMSLNFLKQIMSNGIFKSPVHRVMTNAEKETFNGFVLRC